jgi:glycosyltransferase involved in cell wall biosynthesis
MKVLEAWAAGVPVVAHAWTANGLDEDVRDGVVVPERPHDWQQTVVELLTQPETAGRLAARGLECWERSYSPERIADLVRDVVRRTAEG